MFQNSHFYLFSRCSGNEYWRHLDATLLPDRRFTGLKKKFFSHTIWQAVIGCKRREGSQYEPPLSRVLVKKFICPKMNLQGRESD